LNRVGLDVIEYNPGGIRAYEKAGFKHEGSQRSAVYRDGKFFDLINMGILRSEWTSTEQSDLSE
jgi:RimJ/RimL family protein N-acetyltransferase